MNMKRILTLVLALALCLSLVACGGKEESAKTEPTEKIGENEAKYQITVVDATGAPVSSGVIVRILQNGQQVEMQVANEQGVAEKIMAKGDYTVELKFTDSKASYYYNQEAMTLSADKTQLEVKLFNMPGEGESLHAPMINGESADTTAYPVAEGGTYVTMEVDARNYFLFTPTRSGTYTFALTEGEGTVGYYGSTYFVQAMTAIDPVENVITLSVRPDNIGEAGATSTYVIGVDAKTETGVLVITRTGDHQHTVEDEPWTEYITSHTPSKFTFKATAGKTLTYVDIMNGKTEDYPVVLGSDGFYHMGSEDGALVYINLGKEAPNLSFELMVNGDGLAGGSPVRKYFYDEEGNFVKKEEYTQIMSSYLECKDEETGLYPLTADLAYIINTRSGWWTVGDADYRFEGCNPELGWLFACCYEK